MTVVDKVVNVDQRMLRRLARAFDLGFSPEEIAKELDIDAISTRRILKLLGYSVEA